MNTGIYNIQLNESELKLLLKTLGKLPFEEVYEIIEKIVLSTANKKPERVKKVRTKKTV